MKNKIWVILIMTLLTASYGYSQVKTSIEIKDNWYYLNGERFFIKALGYTIGARPGQRTDGSSADDMELMKFDLKVIKEGGYNAIRTWSPYSEEQLKLVQKSGLKLIMGVGIGNGNYGDPKFIRTCEEKVRKVMDYSKKYDCIITYLVLN